VRNRAKSQSSLPTADRRCSFLSVYSEHWSAGTYLVAAFDRGLAIVISSSDPDE
jgi:hypothetical protein